MVQLNFSWSTAINRLIFAALAPNIEIHLLSIKYSWQKSQLHPTGKCSRTSGEQNNKPALMVRYGVLALVHIRA